MRPAVSVLIPVYNAEKYLPLCLASVLHQTFADIEVLCLDDGSVDQSLSVLRQTAREDSRVRVLTQTNQGVAAARNRLLDEARGRYVAFVDADDLVLPRYLEILHTAAVQTRAEVTKCFFYELEEDGTPRNKTHCHRSFYRPVPAGDGPRFRAGYEDAVLWGKLFERSFLARHRLRFWPGRVAEDFSFVILAFLYAAQVTVVPEKLYAYRKNVPGAITSQAFRMAVGILLNLVELRQELKRRGRWNEQLASAWVHAAVWGICRFRKFSAEQRAQQQPLLNWAYQTVRQEQDFLCGWAKIRWGLFCWLVQQSGEESVFFGVKFSGKKGTLQQQTARQLVAHGG